MVQNENDLSQAAREGDLESIKKVSRKDINKKDANGMTSLHWAAAYGRIEALKILIGKGGNPDKPNNEGSTALHLAAESGQLHCLVFLTNFGGNVYAVNDKGEAPMQAASNEGRRDCVRHLETLVAHQIMQDRPKVEKTQLKAKKEADKRIKEKTKLMLKLDRAYERKTAKQKKFVPRKNLKNLPLSDDNQNNNLTNTNEDLDEEDEDVILKPSFHQDMLNEAARSETSEYETMSSPDDGSSTLSAYQSNRIYPLNPSIASSNVIFEKGGYDSRSTSPFTDITGYSKSTKLTHLSHHSQNNRLAASLKSTHSDKSFIRSGSNHMSVLLPHNPNGSMGSILKGNISHRSVDSSNKKNNDKQNRYVKFNNNVLNQSQEIISPNGTRASLYVTKTIKAGDYMIGPMYTFLCALGLEEYRQLFIDEKIDLKSCLLCNEHDLREIGLPLGPRKVISEAIKKRNTILNATENEFKDTPV